MNKVGKEITIGTLYGVYSQVRTASPGEWILNVHQQRGASQVKKEETAIPDKGRYRGTEEHNALEVLQVASYCRDRYREQSKR